MPEFGSSGTPELGSVGRPVVGSVVVPAPEFEGSLEFVRVVSAELGSEGRGLLRSDMKRAENSRGKQKNKIRAGSGESVWYRKT